MRVLTVCVTLLLSLVSATGSTESRTAPDWTRESLDGEAISLSEVAAEQPVILLFWATWCPYCKALMPHIHSVRLEYGERVRVLAVHFRDDKGNPAAFIEKAGYDFTVIPGGNDLAKSYGVWTTPGLLIVDRDRRVRFDLYALPKPEFPTGDTEISHPRRAAYRAPYWAAELRKALDDVIADQAR
jgi:thiol-disulfide isomerase/thioredoxin